LEQAGADCASFDGGEFSYTAQAVQQWELTGDAQMEWLIDGSEFACSVRRQSMKDQRA